LGHKRDYFNLFEIDVLRDPPQSPLKRGKKKINYSCYAEQPSPLAPLPQERGTRK
jgi:hypothetical protein